MYLEPKTGRVRFGRPVYILIKNATDQERSEVT